MSFASTAAVEAAPCCGGGANVPGILSGDDRAQLSLSLSNAFTVADAFPDGGVRQRASEDREQFQTLRIDAAVLLSDRWQAAASLPLIRRTRERSAISSESAGSGDTTLSVSYEFLPQWSYSLWRPKGFWLLDVNLPTGRSVYESTSLYRLDSRGRGFFGFGTGIFLVKTWGSWDVSLLSEVHRSLGKAIASDSGVLELSPGWGAAATFAAGFSPGAGKWRLGGLVAFARESGVVTSGVIDGQGSAIETWSPGVQLSYLWDPTVSLNVTYLDQSLVAMNTNAAVNRTVSLLFQKRWER